MVEEVQRAMDQITAIMSKATDDIAEAGRKFVEHYEIRRAMQDAYAQRETTS